VGGDRHIAEQLADVAELGDAPAKTELIHQGASYNELYLLLAGSVNVMVHEREVAIRTAGQHVGDMALIDPSARRSASVVACEDVVFARVSEACFRELASEHPDMWRLLAMELCERLRQRNRYVSMPNTRPVLFVGSSTESLPIAKCVQSGLRHDDILVRVWTDRVFQASHFPIEDLQEHLQKSDLAVLVLGPDDRVESRGDISLAPRDNVILELGMFLGALGHRRTLLMCPRGANVRIPTDLLGLTPLEYAPGPEDELPSRVAPVCEDLRRIISTIGVK
jgi:predicted nucleotide-binding protein